MVGIGWSSRMIPKPGRGAPRAPVILAAFDAG
jgi:hypothetical protein